MKIIALIENISNNELIGEHGLSVYIEYNGKKYLLDTGATDNFISNAIKLGVDLSKIDVGILSHGHYDHSGGYKGFLNINSKAKIYARKEVKQICYSKVGPFKKYIGIPKDTFDEYKNRFVYLDDDCKLDEGVWIISHTTKNLEARGKKAYMFRMTEKGLKVDDFKHEQSLVFETEKGLVILNSCSHAGIDNIVKEVQDKLDHKNVLAVIGGFHLKGLLGINSMGVKLQEVKALGNELNKLGVEKIYTCHCTGKPAYKILHDVLGKKVHYFSTGTILEF